MTQCKFCKKQCKNDNSHRNHERLCPQNPTRIYVSYTLGKPAWNKGLTKETNSIIKAQADKLKENYRKPIFTPEGLKRLSDGAKQRGLGGYRPHPNKGVWYKGMWLDSKWELIVAESLDYNNIKWERPKVGFVWTDDNRKYYPDFYLPEFNVYLDPKNSYLRKKDLLKINEASRRNNIKVIVLDEKQLNWDIIQTLIK